MLSGPSVVICQSSRVRFWDVRPTAELTHPSLKTLIGKDSPFPIRYSLTMVNDHFSARWDLARRFHGSTLAVQPNGPLNRHDARSSFERLTLTKVVGLE